VVNKINLKGVTVFLVEQNVKQTLGICSRAYVFENGRILLEGSGKEFLNNDFIREAYLGI